MKKYYECPTQNYKCPYWDWMYCKCAMEIMYGVTPMGQCNEYDSYNSDEEYEEEEECYD